MLALAFRDNVKARLMKADGTYQRVKLKAGEKAHRSQMEFIARTMPETVPRGGGAKSKYAKVSIILYCICTEYSRTKKNVNYCAFA